MTIGERIKERRIELGYTQDELAKKCGYKSRSSINKIELSRNLPLPKIEKMARALECTESYLMGWSKKEDEISDASRFSQALEYSERTGILLKDLMDGRDIQPCDYENVKNIRVHEVKRNYDERLKNNSFNYYLNDEQSEQLTEMIDLFTSANEEQKNAVINLLRSFKI